MQQKSVFVTVSWNGTTIRGNMHLTGMTVSEAFRTVMGQSNKPGVVSAYTAQVNGRSVKGDSRNTTKLSNGDRLWLNLRSTPHGFTLTLPHLSGSEVGGTGISVKIAEADEPRRRGRRGFFGLDEEDKRLIAEAVQASSALSPM